MGEPAAWTREAGDRCSGGGGAHYAHLKLNGECPWCGAYTVTLAKQLKLPLWSLPVQAGTNATKGTKK